MTDRRAALDMALRQIEKQFGKGSVMKLGESTHTRVETISSGSLALGYRTWNRRISAWKNHRNIRTGVIREDDCSAACDCRSAETGGQAAFIDAEHALDPIYARNSASILMNCCCRSRIPANKRLEIAEALVRSGAIDIIVVDSVAALVPKAEIEGEMGDSHVGPASASDVAGIAQTVRRHQQVEDDRDFH